MYTDSPGALSGLYSIVFGVMIFIILCGLYLMRISIGLFKLKRWAYKEALFVLSASSLLSFGILFMDSSNHFRSGSMYKSPEAFIFVGSVLLFLWLQSDESKFTDREKGGILKTIRDIVTDKTL